MLKTLLATTILAGSLAFSVQAQDAPAADPVVPPAEVMPVPEQSLDAPATPMPGDVPPIVENEAAPFDEGWTAFTIETVSADELIGADIRNADNETIASVGDVLLGANGSAESIVAEFGGFLGIGRDRVLLTVDQVEFFRDANETVIVRTSLTPDSLAAMPEYEG